MAKIKIPSCLTNAIVDKHINWVSPLEFERIRKYIEKHPKAERLPLPLLRRQAKLYWYIKDRKNDKNTSN